MIGNVSGVDVGRNSLATAVRADSRARNGTERAEVEAELVQRQTRRRRRRA